MASITGSAKSSLTKISHLQSDSSLLMLSPVTVTPLHIHYRSRPLHPHENFLTDRVCQTCPYTLDPEICLFQRPALSIRKSLSENFDTSLIPIELKVRLSSTEIYYGRISLAANAMLGQSISNNLPRSPKSTRHRFWS